MSIEAFDRTYTYRADGWPLCPQCGEDELWSRVPGHQVHVGEPIPEPGSAELLELCFREPFICYACNWSGRLPHREQGWRLLNGDTARVGVSSNGEQGADRA